MKKNLSIFLPILLFVGLLSCKTEDSVFEKTSNERVNSALDAYQKQLVSAEYGWKGNIMTGVGSIYSFYFKFNDQNRVVMYSDFDKETAVTARESSYLVKALQSPSLIFDTYSYLHLLADPEGAVNGGVYGDGLISDFEFSFGSDTTSNGNITLIGTRNRTRLVLTKATQEESVAYGNGGVGKSMLFSNINLYQSYFKRVTIGGVSYEINVNTSEKIITFTWLEGTASKSFSTPFYYGPLGVILTSPFVNGSSTISGFNDITWDQAKLQLKINANGTAAVVESATRPIAVDVAAPRRWWSTPVASGGEWRTVDGFHINGVDDALGLKNLTSDSFPYVVYLYIPAYNSRYDLFAPAFLEDGGLSLHYGEAPNPPTFTNDGKVIFSSYGTLGTAPATGPVTETNKLLFDTSGYYLIQTSEKTYDMVSVKDPRIWISWFRI